MKEDEFAGNLDLGLINVGSNGRSVLTVFLGAASGVGKTYAMLLAAKERLAEGIDTVIGWAEIHGRLETAALLEGIPTLPARQQQYKGRVFQELDLDSLLARRPQLVVVDDLAHFNTPGSRNARRYQDVAELLAAGISVLTTINIQHVESLNDAITRITSVQIRDTVPDKVLEGAKIRLVDITTEELLTRWHEGKIHIPDQSRAILTHFYRPDNIGVLRELALRYTASHVDHDVETYMKAHSISGPWPKAERVLVCVSASPLSAQLIRNAYRLATSLHAEWLAVNVETTRTPANAQAKEQLARNLRLAEDLGAILVTTTGEDVAVEVLRVAKQRNVTQLVIGKPIHSAWHKWLHGAAIVDKIIRQTDGVGIHVIPGKPEKHKLLPTPSAPRQNARLVLIIPVATMIAGVTLLGKLTEQALGLVNIALAYLIPIMTSGLLWGTVWASLAAVVSILVFDLLFVPPVLQFEVEDWRYLFAFAMFLLVAILVGTIAGRLQQHVARVREREKRIGVLYALSRKIAASADLVSTLEVAAQMTAESVGANVIIFSPDHQGLLQTQASAQFAAPDGQSAMITPYEESAAAWVMENGRIAGKGTGTYEDANGVFLPLDAEGKRMGVLGIWTESADHLLTPDERRTLEAFSSLIALAIYRVRLSEQARQTYRLEESERLWMALFNSLSHDLRTPLSSVTGAVTSLLEEGDVYSESSRRELLETIAIGAARLNRLVGNLFDMARVKSGMLQLKKDWCQIEEIIGVAISRFPNLGKSRLLQVAVDPELPLLKADPALLEQVLANLIDNALKYSEPESELGISVQRSNDSAVVSVANKGMGIAPSDMERVFDQFFRSKSQQPVSGTGLGLTICKAIVEAHGGRIWVESEVSTGATISFSLPLIEKAPSTVPKPGE